MKKLLTSLATISLLSGSLSTMTAWTNFHQKQAIADDLKTENESAEQIALKLKGKTIKLDPNIWLNRNIKDYQNELNAIIVKNGILTHDEAQYVSWDSLSLNVAGWYWTVNFTVTVGGSTVTDNACLDMDSGETTAQIATKLKERKVQLNLDYWNGKNLRTDLTEFRNVIVNEGILTRVEASEIVGLFNGGISGWYNVTGTGEVYGGFINYNINDNNTESTTPNYDGINVVNDGWSASHIATAFHGDYGLKTNMAGDYADDANVMADFRNILAKNGLIGVTDAQYVSLPHTVLTNNPNGNNMNATVAKDGQTATSNVQLECEQIAHTYKFEQDNDSMQLYTNLTPAVIANLKSTFQSESDPSGRLRYFYQLLDNGGFSTSSGLPSCSTSFFNSDNVLESYMGSYGDALDTESDIAADQGDCHDTYNKMFEKDLYDQVMKSDGYLTVLFQWTYTYHDFTTDTYSTSKYSFW